jgi:hypothetical protein
VVVLFLRKHLIVGFNEDVLKDLVEKRFNCLFCLFFPLPEERVENTSLYGCRYQRLDLVTREYFFDLHD